MKYLISGTIGFLVTLLVSLPLQSIIKGREAKAINSAMKATVEYQVSKEKMNEVTIDIKPFVRLEDKKDEPQIKFMPQYPPAAAAKRIEGFVTLRFRVTRGGAVANLHIVESNPPQVFDAAALTAVSKWNFGGKRAASEEQQLRLNFNLGHQVAIETR